MNFALLVPNLQELYVPQLHPVLVSTSPDVVAVAKPRFNQMISTVLVRLRGSRR